MNPIMGAPSKRFLGGKRIPPRHPLRTRRGRPGRRSSWRRPPVGTARRCPSSTPSSAAAAAAVSSIASPRARRTSAPRRRSSSSAPLLVLAWTLSYLLGWSDPLRFFLGDLLGAITLILVALLKNAERRAEHAVQFKLDAIAEALLEIRRGTDEGAADDLERAIGRHKEV